MRKPPRFHLGPGRRRVDPIAGTGAVMNLTLRFAFARRGIGIVDDPFRASMWREDDQSPDGMAERETPRAIGKERQMLIETEPGSLPEEMPQGQTQEVEISRETRTSRRSGAGPR